MWLDSFPPGTAPSVAIEFGAPTGTGISGKARQDSGQLLRDPDWPQLLPLWRKAAALFRNGAERLLPFTFDSAASSDYSLLLGRSVETMPAVHRGPAAIRLRSRQDGKVMVAFLGNQRTCKGYHLIPEIAKLLQQRSVPARLLVHNGDTEDDPVSRELRAMAAAHPDFAFEHRPAGGAYWQELLDRSDLIVLPYEPLRYRASYSAVAVEAVSTAIPIVVPAGTTMETLSQSCRSGAVTFAEWNATAVVNAIQQAVADFENRADLARSGAESWRQANGAERFAERLLELVPLRLEQPGELPSMRGERVVNLALDSVFAINAAGVRGLRACLNVYRRTRS